MHLVKSINILSEIKNEKRYPVATGRAKRARYVQCAPYLIVHPWWLRWAFNQLVSLSGHCSNARTIHSFRPHYNALDSTIDIGHAWEVNHSACIFETAGKPTRMYIHVHYKHRHSSQPLVRFPLFTWIRATSLTS